MFAIRRLQELARKKRIPPKEYNSVDRTLLWTALARFGVPQTMISAIRQLHDGMRACVRRSTAGCARGGSLWNTSSRVRAHAPPVQHLLRSGYKRGLRAFQGGQRHHGRFGTPEEEKEGGAAGGSNCRRVSPRDAALGYDLR